MSKKVKTDQRKRIAPSILSPTQAIEAAQNLVSQLNLADLPQGSLLANPKLKPQMALLLRDDADAPEDRSYSYVVTYAIENDRDESGAPLVRICILLNGTDGSFEEITTFAMPVTYLSADDAISVVLSALQLSTDKATDAAANLVFRPCEISHVRAYPFWEVVLDGHTYYVDQRRKLYRDLSPGRGGS
jgi:hypothetical protein